MRRSNRSSSEPVATMAKVPSGVVISGLPHRLAKLLRQAAQNSNFGPAPPQARARSQLRTADSLKGIPYRSHAAGLGRAQERLEYLRKHVGVLVRIQVSDRDSRRLQLADLSRRFRLDLVRSQTSKQGERGKLADPFAKARSPGGAACGDRADCPSRFAEPGERRPPARCDSPLRVEAETWASATASSKACPLAINVADVTIPPSCASTMARFTPEVRPKSSALMIRRRTAPV